MPKARDRRRRPQRIAKGGRNIMLRNATQNRRRTTTAALTAALVLLPASTRAYDWNETDAADTTAGQLKDHQDGSEDPDGMTVGSGDPEKDLEGSEDPDGMTDGSEDPDAMVTGAENIDRHEENSQDLTNLHVAAPDPGDEPIEVSGQSRWAPTADPEVVIARDNLIRAEKRATAARTAYGNMIETNYPAGDARIRIINERDEAMQALEKAKSALAAADE
jgi:hypothetical protein